MTKNEILTLLSKHISILKTKNYHNNNFQINDIEWKIENSNKNKVLFYHLNNNQKSLDDFQQRINSASYGLLIINSIDGIDTIDYNCSIENINNIIIVDEKDFLKAQKILLDIWYPLNLHTPTHKKILVGVTGTNGKTTTVFLCQQIANLMQLENFKAAALGTLGVCEDGKNWNDVSSGLTTPPLIELQKILHELFHIKNFSICFMEVSSHAVATQRIYGLQFDVVAFTNLTQDHLDFHKNMDDYFLTKCDLVKKHLKENGIFIILRSFQ